MFSTPLRAIPRTIGLDARTPYRYTLRYRHGEPGMHTAKIFRNGGSQAVRLPKAYQFADDEVLINKIGDVVLLCPRGRAWEALARSVDLFSDDYMADRDQPTAPDARPAI